ncbi:Uncharacterized protein TOPH_08698 [Tolypocladium ophioglossoides CBS 100239]|uniref:FHA domain-containing protein n=1 Tax=Tolypocladium ophioglossoides (strain CBS 100239) TaxID=1163406 RepID=A0A0L0MXP4_TOLOC|nr:Uncharacterized protein TOPH_08698 [Tolypocladium ophioglossoides CBS 100239]
MSAVQYTDEVQVVLTSFGPSPGPGLKERRLVLSKDRVCVPIGRTSKRIQHMTPGRGNAWIDSAVMSREHAELCFDSAQKKVFIRDIGSLHGTFHNGVRLAQDRKQLLTQGDILKFGIAVERNAQDFPPCVMKVTLNYGTEIRPEANPLVFRVPDDSDVEDDASDEDMSIQNSTRALRENGIRPDQPVESSKVVAIDLTSDEENEAESHMSPTTPAGQRSGLFNRPFLTESRAKVDEAVDDWEDYDSNAQSSVPFPLPSLPLEPSLEPSRDLSDNEPISGFDGDMDFESDDEFGFDQDAPSPAGSLPSPTCDCDDAVPERTVSLPSIELESPTTEEMKQPGGVFCDPTSTLKSGMDAEQPKAQSQLDRLPSIDSSHGIHSGGVQLPPIADTMGAAASIPPQHFSQQSVAEFLGEKTRKFEYFSARSFNKRLAAAPAALKQPTPPRQPSRFLNPIRDDACVDDTNNDRDTRHLGRQENDSSMFTLNQPYLADASTSTLLASGAKFLSSPLQERDKEHLVLTPPELDETSAYQFERSKKAAEDDAAASRRTHVAINDLVDVYPIGQAPEDGQPSNKRKAADISKLAPEDGCASAELVDEHASTQPDSSLPRPVAPSPAPAADESEANRPAKRIRRAAEVFGYVALGGVAVMSALIASAPTL